MDFNLFERILVNTRQQLLSQAQQLVSSSSTPRLTGYNIDSFVDQQQAEAFKCNICHDVARDAVSPAVNGNESCAHLFCEGCLKNWLETKRQCPVDRKEVKPGPGPGFHANGFVRLQVRNLQVKCVNLSAGCKWAGTVAQWEREHPESSCGYVKVKCACGEQVLQCELPQHKLSECAERMVPCLQCGAEVRFHFLSFFLSTGFNVLRG